jgi:hypothetical protein
MELTIGTRVRFKEQWDIFPFCIIRKGETGTISRIEPQGSDDAVFSGSIHYWIKPDTPHPELNGDDWKGEIQIGQDERIITEYLEEE